MHIVVEWFELHTVQPVTVEVIGSCQQLLGLSASHKHRLAAKQAKPNCEQVTIVIHISSNDAQHL